MAISPDIKKAMEGSSFIRKMFEEGIALKKKYGQDNVYDFSIGNPDLEPPEEVLEEIKKEALSTVKARHGYMPNAGYMETRQAIAKKISMEQGISLDGNNVIMSVGAAGAINTVFKAILSAGDEVIVPAPYFVEYRSYAANHGGKLITVKTKEDFSLDIDAIKNALTEKTAAVLINSPNNPTGKVYTDEDIKLLAATLNEHTDKTGRRPYLIADEPYRNIIYDGRKVSPIFQFYPDSVVVSSFAKDLSLPGERLGYIAVNPACSDSEDLVGACIYSTRVLGYVNAPAFFQRVIVNCWNAKADYSSYENRKNMLTSIMDEAGITYASPEGAFYLFCKVPENKKETIPEGKTSDGVFCDHLKKYNILGVPGTGFGRSGYIRLAYCTSIQTIKGSRNAFIKAVQEW
ncbi:MAG: pyridoxal phosphate-dependent aminotransferase [Treponemataceae bacterium]|nr:pyridoxal phosphate-dependent aminotransferase [Treponemataceae bacterium]